MIKFLQKFEELNTNLKIIINALVLLCIAYLDIVTGAEIAFSIFYLIPIALIAWTAGTKLGFIFSFAGAVLWLISDEISGKSYSYQIILFWNSLARFCFFFIVVSILGIVNKQKKIEEEFTHFLIHDLRSPLSNILSSLKILKDDSFDEGDVSKKEIIDLSIASGNRMVLFINSLLDLGRLQNKKMPINLKEIDIQKVIDNSVEQVKFLAFEKNIKIKKIINADKINSDEDLLLRIASNLLNNAIKVSPENSEIILETKNSKRNTIEFNILDQGPGIKKGLEDKLFGKYTQLEVRKKGGIGSSGLGLAFCKTAIESQGGNIWIENKKNGGAKIAFTLPKNLKHKSSLL